MRCFALARELSADLSWHRLQLPALRRRSSDDFGCRSGHIVDVRINMKTVLPMLGLGDSLEGQARPSGRIDKGPGSFRWTGWPASTEAQKWAEHGTNLGQLLDFSRTYPFQRIPTVEP